MRDRKDMYLNGENTLARFLGGRTRIQDEQLRVLENYKYYNAIIRRQFLSRSMQSGQPCDNVGLGANNNAGKAD